MPIRHRTGFRQAHHGRVATQRETPSPAEAAAGTEQGPIERLERWQQFGGTWQVIARTGRSVTISLRRCDGGEEAARLSSADAALLAWLGDRTSSD